MVSVCIATYNGEQFIREQLNSILPQLKDNDEIIVSDDSSSDGTLEIISSYNDGRIKIISSQKFCSPIFNFENALKYAKGDYIFLCDQDDVWLPNKIEKMIDTLQRCDLVVSDCKVVDSHLKVIEDSFFSMRKSGTGFWKNLFKNTYLGCCMAFRKDILKYILPFPKNIAMHDIWIGLSVELRGRSEFLNESLLLYRRHGNNVSFGGEGSHYSLSYKIKYRAYMFFELLKKKFY
ncbi:glycosyltransferase family 2 protein [Phocaeicola sp.]